MDLGVGKWGECEIVWIKIIDGKKWKDLIWKLVNDVIWYFKSNVLIDKNKIL